MTTPTPTGNRRSWDYPDCPECGSDVLVERRPANTRSHDFKCWGCGSLFGDDTD